MSVVLNSFRFAQRNIIIKMFDIIHNSEQIFISILTLLYEVVNSIIYRFKTTLDVFVVKVR